MAVPVEAGGARAFAPAFLAALALHAGALGLALLWRGPAPPPAGRQEIAIDYAPPAVDAPSAEAARAEREAGAVDAPPPAPPEEQAEVPPTPSPEPPAEMPPDPAPAPPAEERPVESVAPQAVEMPAPPKPAPRPPEPKPKSPPKPAEAPADLRRERPVARPPRPPAMIRGNEGASARNTGGAASQASTEGVSAAAAADAQRRYASEVSAIIQRRVRAAFTEGAGRSASARIRITISRSGEVTASSLVQSSGRPDLDRIALAAAAPGARMPPFPPALVMPSVTIAQSIRFDVAD